MNIRRVPTDRFPPVKPPASARRRARTASDTPKKALVGKRLAAVAHPEAQRLDPERRGFGPRELHAALVRAGVVNGENGYMAVYTALNAKTGLFERAQRGRYVWREPPPGP